MLRSEDEEWLRATYPSLTRRGNGLAGLVEFKAAYDSQSNRFVILEKSASDEVAGLALSGRFMVRIEERINATFSSLPAVFLDDVEVTESRHFGHDRSACLCSPFEEGEFLRPEFQFRKFLEQLVIPFLYGQVFYDLKREWPWPEYSHGWTGLFEAYGELPGDASAEDCLKLLRRYPLWQKIKDVLLQKPYIKGHTPCFCPKMDQIRRCHPKVHSEVLGAYSGTPKCKGLRLVERTGSAWNIKMKRGPTPGPFFHPIL